MAEPRTTSRFKVLSEVERKIGLRVLFARRCIGASQSRIAEMAGLTTAQLANIESGRVPLRAVAGLKLCRMLEIHPRWLFSGRGEQSIYYFDSDAAKWIEKVALKNQDRAFSEVIIPFAWFLFFNNEQAEAMLAEVASKSIIPKLSNTDDISRLTLLYESVKLNPVKPQLPKLLGRLRRATQEKGKKTELADFLGVKLASVSQWLSESPDVKREPGGEITLKMLYWVERQERK